jgi:hypothetical protein
MSPEEHQRLLDELSRAMQDRDYQRVADINAQLKAAAARSEAAQARMRELKNSTKH